MEACHEGCRLAARRVKRQCIRQTTVCFELSKAEKNSVCRRCSGASTTCHFHGRKGSALRTIAIINQKGGSGKTTVAINLAAVLAAMGRRTLLVDMDPQSHCALGLAVPENQLENSIGDMLRAGLNGSIAMSDITWQISRKLDLAPSAMNLAMVEAELSNAPDKDRRLAQVLGTVADDYEFCIIDCPPSIGLLTFNALRAASEVIIPVETGYFAMHGSIKQEATIEMLARRANHQCRFKVLATMYDVRTKLAREILGELRRHFGEKLLPVVVNFNSKLKEAASFGQPITEYDPASRGMQDFDKLASWLLANPVIEQPVAAQVGQAGEAVPNQAVVPALSRAAELVERARALSARTAALASRLSKDTDIASEESATQPTPPAPREHSPVPAGQIAGQSRQPVQAMQPTSNGQSIQPTQPTQPAQSAHGYAETLVVEPRQTPAENLDAKLARVYGVRHTTQGLLFVHPNEQARQVAIAADFNNWQPSLTPMRRDGDLGVWQACVPVPPGRYRYRLVVDGQWVQDPYNTTVEKNPFGELNNIVEIR